MLRSYAAQIQQFSLILKPSNEIYVIVRTRTRKKISHLFITHVIALVAPNFSDSMIACITFPNFLFCAKYAVEASNV